jgi:hypothetical protein
MKHRLLRALLLPALCCIMPAAFAQTITNVVVTPGTVCPGGTINVSFTRNSMPGNSNESAQLSDAAGSFATPTPLTGANLSSTGGPNGTITGLTLPAGITPGTGYKVRILTDFAPGPVPSTEGTLTVTPNVGTPVFIAGLPTSGYPGTNPTFTANASNGTVTYSITQPPATPTVTINSSGHVSIPAGFTGPLGIVATGTGCGPATSATFNYTVLDNGIVTSALPPNSFRQGANLSVPFTINTSFSAGNVFTAQLSDLTGSFATPVNIGTLAGTAAGSINATIPVSTPLGSNYRIRVVSSNPAITGTNNGTDIAITSCNPSTFPVTGGGAFCIGGIGVSIGLGGSETGVSYQLFLGAAAQGTPVNGTGGAISFGLQLLGGTFTVVATRTQGGCTTTMPSSALITINALPTATISGTSTICIGNSASIGFNGTPNATVTYKVNNGANQTILLDGAGNATLPVSPIANTTYSIVSVASSLCNATVTGQTATITVNPIPVYTATSPVICSGETTSISLGSNVPGSQASWTVSGVTGVSGATGNSTPITGPLAQTLLTTGPVQGSLNYNITPVYTSGGTTCTGTPVTVNVRVNPVPTYTASAQAAFCSGGATSISLASDVAGSQATWALGTNVGVAGATANSVATSGSITQTLTTSASSQASIVYAITPIFTANGKTCSGTAVNVIQAVNPIPAYNGPTNSSICSGETSNLALSATATGSTFAWTVLSAAPVIGASGGSLNSIQQTLINPGTVDVAPVVYSVIPTFTASGVSCVGSGVNVTVNVNKIPVMSVPSSPAICSGTPTNIALSASPATSTFAWTIGTNTGGITGATPSSGSIIAQTLTNPNNASIGSIVYNVTPTFTAGGKACVGGSLSVTVNVQPKPAYSGPSAVTICSGTSPGLSLTGSTAASFSWTVGTITGGILNATSGSGTTITDVLTNPSNSATGSVIYNVAISSSASCTGNPSPVTVTVNPIPAYNGPTAPAAICSGSQTNINLTATAPGSTFAWTLGTNTGGVTGATASNGGTIAQILTNPSIISAGSVVYNVRPTFTAGGQSCQGAPVAVTQSVNPTATLSPASGSYTICSGNALSIPLGSSSTGSTFSWTVGNVNPLVTITGQSAGTGSTITQTLTNPTNTSPGTVQYNVSSVTSGGCPGGTATYIVQVNPRPKLINVAPSQGICSGTPGNVVLAATVGAVFSWTTSAPASIAAASIPAGSGGIIPIQPVSSNNATTDTVTYYIISTSTTTPACPSLGPDSFKLGVNPRPAVTVAPNYQICSGTATNIPLTATAPSSFSWTKSNESTGISGATNSSGDTIQQALVNSLTSGANGSVQYNVTATSTLAGCSGNPTALTVTVRAVPLITNTNLFTKICSDDSVRITLSANVSPYIAKWTVSTSTLITGQREDSTLSAPHIIHQKLVNNDLAHRTSDSINYTVRSITTSGGLRCEGTPVNFRVAVNPLPVLSLSPKTICSGQNTQIDLQPSISTPGQGTFGWTVAPVGPDITGAANDASKTVISQVLTNNRFDVTETVQYNVNAQSAEGCNTTTATPLVVTVNPLPKLLNANDTTICSESVLAFTPSPSVALDSVIYNRTNISGRIQSFSNIKPAAPFAINDLLTTNNYMLLDSLTYTFTLYSTRGCVFPGQVKKVYVNPVPDTPGILVAPPNLCVNNQFVNFSARRSAITTPAQEVFVWTVDNGASVLQLDSTNRQYALISFPNQGGATVMLRSKVKGANACWNKGSTRRIEVGPGSSNNPNVVYFSGNLVCQAPGVTKYQWGFDLKADLSPTVLEGETNQNYKVNLADANTRLYWVLATFADGCTRKAYFNTPALGTAPVASTGSAAISVYPNPATESITVELPLIKADGIEIDIYDLAGKHLERRLSSNNKTSISVSNLTPGCYIVTCTQAGVRIATSRFIKN